MEETRKFVRIEWPVIIKYKTIEEPYTQDRVVGKNMSEGGACFIVYERLQKGARLDMQIEFPFDTVPIFAKGEVRWVKKIGEELTKAFEVGFMFTEIDPKDQRRFKMYLEKEVKERRPRQ